MSKVWCQDLLGAGDVAQRAQRVGPAARDDVAFAAAGFELIRDPVHGDVHFGPGVHHPDRLYAQKVKQEIVAARVRAIAAGHALLQHQATAQPLGRGSRQGQAAVVDCTAPWARASATRNLSLRVLSPPPVRPVRLPA